MTTTLETRGRCLMQSPAAARADRAFPRRALMLAVMTLAVFRSPAQAQEVSPRQLLEMADFGPPVVSPDGGRVAFRIERASIERNTYDTTWYVQELMDGAEPRRVADGGVPLRDAAGISSPAVPVWSPDGRWIHYIALVDGRIDVWRAAADGSGAEPLALDAADVREFSLSDDGLQLFYRVGATREEVAAAEQAEYDNGIRIDKQVPIGQGLFRSINIEGRWATQRYVGMWFGRAPLLADAPQRWKVIDLADLHRRDLPTSYRPPRPAYSPWALAPRPRREQSGSARCNRRAAEHAAGQVEQPSGRMPVGDVHRTHHYGYPVAATKRRGAVHRHGSRRRTCAIDLPLEREQQRGTASGACSRSGQRGA